MKNLNNKTALITGASSGIGYELTKLFAMDKCSLVLVGRSEEELNSFADALRQEHGVQVTVIAKDLFEPEAAEELYNDVKAKGLTINYLVNDAGQGVYGKFWETDLQQELDIIQLNVTSLVILTKLFLKDMVARNEGRILQVASMVSKAPSPLMAVYAGTKAFVYNFTQSIINELKDTNVTVTALRPGATDTDFFNKAGAEDAKIVQEDKLGPAADVAKDGYEAMMSGEHTIVSGMKNKMMDKMGNIMTDEAVAAQMRSMNDPATGDGQPS